MLVPVAKRVVRPQIEVVRLEVPPGMIASRGLLIPADEQRVTSLPPAEDDPALRAPQAVGRVIAA